MAETVRWQGWEQVNHPGIAKLGTWSQLVRYCLGVREPCCILKLWLFKQPVTQLFLLRNKQPGLVVVSLCRYHQDRKVSRKDWAAQGDEKKKKLYWKHPKNVLKNILFSLLCLITGNMCISWISKSELHSYHQIWGSQKLRLRKSCKRLMLFLMFNVITNKFWDFVLFIEIISVTNKFWDFVLFIEIISVWVDSGLKIVWEGRSLKY